MTKAQKAEYDREYRRKNRAMLKRKKAAYFQRTYDPAAAAVKRQERMPYHVEYCRQPKYKAKKSAYDRRRKLSRFGDYAEAFAALEQLQKEIRMQMPNRFDRYAQSGRKQWNPLTQQRRRNGNPIDAIDSY